MVNINACCTVESGFVLFLDEAVDDLIRHTKLRSHGTWVRKEWPALLIRIARYEELQIGIIKPVIEAGKSSHQLRDVLALVKSTETENVALAQSVACVNCCQHCRIGDGTIFVTGSLINHTHTFRGQL